jgi:nucleoside 2-deoxyribosyltransferase
MMRIYLAGPIFNPEQLGVIQYLKETAEAHEHEVFSPYHNSQGIWAGRAPKDCSPSERAQVLEDNIKHLYWCDVLLCWVGGMGGFTDPGVVWEMGCAYAEGKFQLAYIDEAMDSERQSMNLMLAGTIDAVCRSWVEINAALGALAEPDMGTVSVRTMFPTSVLGQEAEPIV